MKIYILALLLLVFQSSILIKNLAIFNFTPDFLVILIILYTLNHNLKGSLKFSLFVGTIQDLLNPTSIAFNLVSKTTLAALTYGIKNRFYLSDMLMKSIMIISLSSVDIAIKIFLTFLKTGIFYVTPKFLVYIFLNFLIFYIVQILNENR
ncbi:hypothetical protein [Persephonella sp.]